MQNHRKLRLDVLDLEVESFDSALHPAAKRGTVGGNEYSCPGTCLNTCAGGVCPPGADTEDPTCADTCYWRGSFPFYDVVC
ncbi:MAG TPA: hypothetical protein VGO40_19385 [Longimicrobium sp.]|jgi:hypothetical protein|nr:hypothetical protein [Longimicrobium sp.]